MTSADSGHPRDEHAGRPSSSDLRTLVRQYLACPADAKPPSFLAFVRTTNPHVFSHHACERSDYLDHVWRIGGLYVCRGCTTVLVTTVLFAATAFLTRWPVRLSTIATAATFSALLLASLLPLRDGPRTLLHDLRRAALGALLGSAIAYLVLCEDWRLRGVVLGVYSAVLLARYAWRRTRRQKDRE